MLICAIRDEMVDLKSITHASFAATTVRSFRLGAIMPARKDSLASVLRSYDARGMKNYESDRVKMSHLNAGLSPDEDRYWREGYSKGAKTSTSLARSAR